MKLLFPLVFLGIFFSACSHVVTHDTPMPKEPITFPENTQTAIFAGGCFWCTESAFQETPGVLEAVSGFTGGHTENPTYDDIHVKDTGHAEAVEVFYDPKQITYEELLDVFWKNVNPTDKGGQFYDRGSVYRTAIFYGNDEEKILAEASRKALEESGKFDDPIVTTIEPASTFYPASEKHQDFYKHSSTYYKQYKKGSGRDAFFESIWGPREDLK